ncbi:MAG TPA: hypothetical protein VFC87_03410, partial [Perlabentimonas sp.]|nr:hypothetical protein [Perlabentimonas sp.]
VLLSLLTLGLSSISFGQGSYLNNRLSFKLGVSKTPELANWRSKFMSNNFWFESNYGHSKFLESGIYLGYTNFSNIDITENNQIITSSNISNAFFYGVNTNFHIMPLFNFANEPRFDVYISGKTGFVSYIAPKSYILNGTSFDAGVFGGINYYIFRRLGVYAEYGYYIIPRANFFDPGFKLGITLKY